VGGVTSPDELPYPGAVVMYWHGHVQEWTPALVTRVSDYEPTEVDVQYFWAGTAHEAVNLIHLMFDDPNHFEGWRWPVKPNPEVVAASLLAARHAKLSTPFVIGPGGRKLDVSPDYEHPIPEFEKAVNEMFDAFDVHDKDRSPENLDQLTDSIEKLRTVYKILDTGSL
jgi:hypothetical protein